MKRGRHKIDYSREARDAQLKKMSLAAFDANQDAKRCKTPFCGAAGECLACGADQGEGCLARLFEGCA